MRRTHMARSQRRTHEGQARPRKLTVRRTTQSALSEAELAHVVANAEITAEYADRYDDEVSGATGGSSGSQRVGWGERLADRVDVVNTIRAALSYDDCGAARGGGIERP